MKKRLYNSKRSLVQVDSALNELYMTICLLGGNPEDVQKLRKGAQKK